MHRGARIATVAVVGLIAASPVGYAIGSQQGNDSADSTQELKVGNDATYAVIPPAPISETLVEMCREKLSKDPDNACRVLLAIGEKRQQGKLPPGEYTKKELESVLGTDVP